MVGGVRFALLVLECVPAGWFVIIPEGWRFRMIMLAVTRAVRAGDRNGFRTNFKYFNTLVWNFIVFFWCSSEHFLFYYFFVVSIRIVWCP